MTPLGVVPLMGVIVSVGILIDSAEVLSSRRMLSADGFYSWEVLGAGRRYLVRGPFANPLSALFRYPNVLALQWVQVVASLSLMCAWVLPSDPQRVLIAAAALCAGSARLLFYMRQQLGLDGSDQMFSIVLFSCGFAALFGDTTAGVAAACYAGLQMCLSYAVSGIAKAVSPQWRSGRAIVGITGTIGYGNPDFHRFVSAHRVVARLLCWSVIIFECGATLLAFGGLPGLWALVVLGLAFHSGVAAVMGLNTFVWAFAAAYPAVFLLAAHLPVARF